MFILRLALTLGIAPSVPADTVLISNLPVEEARASTPGRTLAVLYSGDGNWAGFVKGLTRELNERGFSVVGVKSRSYLVAEPRKTPELVARDLERLLRTYLAAWHSDSVLLIGYSRGADLAPFMVTRLSDELRRRISFLVLLSPSTNASFEFHLTDLLSDRPRATDLPLLPELRMLRGSRILCVYGRSDRSALCPLADSGLVRPVALDQGHKMGDPVLVAKLITESMAKP